MFRYSLPVLKMYSVRYIVIRYRFSVNVSFKEYSDWQCTSISKRSQKHYIEELNNGTRLPRKSQKNGKTDLSLII